MVSDEDFLNLFNEYYPFERYILKTPHQINELFDDVFLTEIFVPYTELKHIVEDDGRVWTNSVNRDEVYVKLKGAAGEMRFAFFDFDDHIRLNIIETIFGDMGDYALQGLYIDEDDGKPLNEEDLLDMLKRQKTLITEKYGVCNRKRSHRDNIVLD